MTAQVFRILGLNTLPIRFANDPQDPGLNRVQLIGNGGSTPPTRIVGGRFFKAAFCGMADVCDCTAGSGGAGWDG